MLLHGRLLYARERWKDAEQVLAPLAGDSANVVSYLGYRGVIAARLGDWEAARSYAAQLENLDRPFPYQRGPITHWRADITALLGDNEETVRLLHQAMNEGIGWGMWLHTDMDLEPLHGFPPFEEMMRPEG